MRRYHLSFAVVLLVILAVLLVYSLGYPYRARVLPMIVIGLAILLLVGELVKELLATRTVGSVGAGRGESQQVSEGTGGQVKFIVILAWIAALAVMIWVLGLVLALPLFTCVYIKMQRERWFWAVSLGVTMLVVVYVGFGLLLKVPLYEGLLFR